MLTGKKIPFISENSNMKNALKFISIKKLGVLVARNHQKKTTGIITDGQIRRKSEKKGNLQQLRVKDVMTKNPISIEADVLAAKALSLMNDKKITSLIVSSDADYKKRKAIFKPKGILHIHSLLKYGMK